MKSIVFESGYNFKTQENDMSKIIKFANPSKRKPYYTLIERLPNGKWYPQFGDHDRADVIQEMQSMMESGSFVKGTKYKIIKTDGKRDSLICALKVENGLLDVEKD